jgi:hypothetical protein
VFADLYSEVPVDGELTYSIEDNVSTRKVKFDGERTVKLGDIERGVTSVEAYLYDEDLLASQSADIRNPEKVEIVLFAPKIDKGDVRKVKAVVRNPNPFRVTRRVSLNTSKNVALNLFENGTKLVELEPGQDRVLNWKVIGLEKGRGNVTASGETVGVNVGYSHSSTIIQRPTRILGMFHSRSASYTDETTSSGRRQVISTSRGKLALRRGHSFEHTVLSTPEFEVSINRTPERIIRKYSSSRGEYRSVMRNGRASVSSSIDPEMAEAGFELLKSEMEKFRTG